MAIVVDEHGSVAGVVTVEDLVEEIIGEIGEDDRVPSPDAVREPDGSLILRGSVSLEKVQELFGVEWNVTGEESATTIAGLLNHIAGHVPSGENTWITAACASKFWKRISGRSCASVRAGFLPQFPPADSYKRSPGWPS